jgi:hypothetical protein
MRHWLKSQRRYSRADLIPAAFLIAGCVLLLSGSTPGTIVMVALFTVPMLTSMSRTKPARRLRPTEPDDAYARAAMDFSGKRQAEARRRRLS